MLQRIPALLERMLEEGLSDDLLHALTRMVEASPALLPKIQGPILQQISQTLTGHPFFAPTGRTQPSPHPPYPAAAATAAEINTSLRTLRYIPWTGLGAPWLWEYY